MSTLTINMELQVYGEKGAGMKRHVRHRFTVVSLFSVVVLLSACGGSGGGGSSSTALYSGKTSQAAIDEQSVKGTLAGMQDIFPSCSATGVSKVATGKVKPLLAVVKTARLVLQPTISKRVGKSVSLLATTTPSPRTGDCGGTLTYPTYSHSSGTTTMSVKWDNYCTTDSFGNRTTFNGTLSAVDAGTPTASGPVTSKLTTEIPRLTVVEVNSSGTVIANETIRLIGFEYLPAAGASANLANLPGTIRLSSFELNEDKTGKAYMLQNLNMTTSIVGSDTQMTISGRIFRGTSGYADLTTDTPLVIDSSQNLKSGAISFTGTNGSKATLTAVAGTGQAFSVAVNGTSLAGAQLNCNGL